jgi:hypothetical protein
MFRAVQQVQSTLTAVHRIAAVRIVVLLVSSCCLSEQSLGDDKTAHQRFVVEVSGMIRMKTEPATETSDTSRVEVSSAGEVVLALSSSEEPASSSDAVFLLHSGQTCHLSLRRGSGSLQVQTVSLSGQPCLELAEESTPVLTITSI